MPFCGPHTKTYGVIGFSKHYNIQLDPKIGLGACAIRQILCVCVECKSMLDKSWVDCFTPQQQTGYQPVTDFT